MNELTPSAPDGAGAAGHDVPPPNPGPENQQRAQARRRNSGQILDQQQCLAGISQLPGLLATGMVKPQTANSILGAFNSLLRHYERSDQDSSRPAVSNEDVLQAMRENPAALRMLEPFLTDEQWQMVMQEEATDGSGQT